MGTVLGFSEHVNQAAQSVEYNRQWVLNKDGAQGSAKNNHCRRRLQNLRKVSTLQQESGNNAAHSNQNTAQRGFIHSQLRQSSGCASVSEGGGAATAKLRVCSDVESGSRSVFWVALTFSW